MIYINRDVQKRLIEILIPLSTLENPKKRRAILVRAGLKDLLPKVELTGPSDQAIPLLFHFLSEYGQVEEGQLALELFLKEVMEDVGVDVKAAIENLLNEILNQNLQPGPPGEDPDPPPPKGPIFPQPIAEPTLEETKELLVEPDLRKKITEKPTVFISYSHADSKFVNELADKLEDSDVDVWIDKWKIKVGDSITDKINEGIDTSDFLIVVLSSSSVESKWVKEEINAALIRNIEQNKRAFILPVLTEDCEIPTLLQHRKYANFKDDPKEGFQDLLEALGFAKITPEIPPLTPPQPSPSPRECLDMVQTEDIVYDYVIQFQPITKENLDFWMAATLVSNKLYWCFTQEEADWQPDGADRKNRVVDQGYLHHWEKGHPKEDEFHLPVTNISIPAARAFAAWMSQKKGGGFRLPTLLEWRLAVQAGRADWLEKEIEKGNVYFKDNSHQLREVNVSSPNPYCIHDLLGNAYDLCLDLSGQAILAGGCFTSTKAQLRKEIKLTKSNRDDIRYMSFRLVCDHDPKK